MTDVEARIAVIQTLSLSSEIVASAGRFLLSVPPPRLKNLAIPDDAPTYPPKASGYNLHTPFTDLLLPKL